MYLLNIAIVINNAIFKIFIALKRYRCNLFRIRIGKKNNLRAHKYRTMIRISKAYN